MPNFGLHRKEHMMKLELSYDGVVCVDGIQLPDSIRIIDLEDLLEEANLIRSDFRKQLIHIDVLPKVTAIQARREDIVGMKIGDKKIFHSKDPEVDIEVMKLSKNFVIAIQIAAEVIYVHGKATNVTNKSEEDLLCN